MKLRCSIVLVALACFAWGCSNRTPLTLGDGGLEPVEEPCDVLAELGGLSGGFEAAVRVTSPVAAFCENDADSKFAGLYELVVYEAPSEGELVVSGDAPMLLSTSCGVPTGCDRDRWISGVVGLDGYVARMRIGRGQRVFVYVQSGRYSYRLVAVDELEDCDGDPANGYEVDTSTDALHCGACGVSCPEGDAGRWRTGCSNGACCARGRADCDGAVANGCEVDLASSATHCGGCDMACDFATGCLGGACCPTGFSNCDGSAANGCETNLLTEETSCGVCGLACRPGEECAEGTCVCGPGFSDCDGAAANGCETDIMQNDTHCGECGVACGATELCDAGVCVPRACAPDETRCADATTLERCDMRGMGFDATPCGARSTCSEGACRAWVCTPGELRCVDGTLAAREICDSDGLRWVPSPACGARSTCTGAGNCTPWACTPNEASCGRGASTRICNPDGLGYSAIMDCGPSESCDPITGMCDGWACMPGVTTCVDETNTQRICRADGLEFVDEACGAGTTCQAGECVPWLCTPGAFSCADVSTRRVCNEDGLGYSAADCTGPAMNGYACVDDGACVERVCVPGTVLAECASITARSICNADGQGYSPVACGADESCSSGLCVARICAPGTARCVEEAGLTGREVCEADGLSYSSAPCSSTESCTGTGSCMTRICGPGTTMCVGSNGFRTCSVDGLAYGGTTSCAMGSSCDPTTNLCTTWTCAPGSSACVSATSRSVCNADGLGSTTSNCDVMQVCSDGVCVLSCSAGTADCDGDSANGCETNLLTSSTNCGDCGTACAGTCADGICSTCSSSSASNWLCGIALTSAGEVWTSMAYGPPTLSGVLDPVAASSARAAACGTQTYRMDDGTGQYLVLPVPTQTSCEGTYDIRLYGRINTQFQRSLGLRAHFDDVWTGTQYVRIDRWVWNSAGEAGVDVGTAAYNRRLDWWGMPSTNEWFELRLVINTISDMCTASFVSDAHFRTHTFSCVMPKDVAPRIRIQAGAPARDRGGSPNADFIGVWTSPPLAF